MIPRVLEPEAMDTPEEAAEYDAMDHSGVNSRFVADLRRFCGGRVEGLVLDLGIGTARIPIELCRVDPEVNVVGVDLARWMLEVAEVNINKADLEDRIKLQLGDGKELYDEDETYSGVMSNTIVHHVPDPESMFVEMIRLAEEGGFVFVRDLVRPETPEQVDWYVRRYAGKESAKAKALFAASLNAAFTLEEVRNLVSKVGSDPNSVRMSSNRHWTWAWKRPYGPEGKKGVVYR